METAGQRREGGDARRLLIAKAATFHLFIHPIELCKDSVKNF